MAATRTPVFVDCDNTMGIPGQEIDDGLTILYLLGSPLVDVVGISATHGNGAVDDVMRATRSLLDRVRVDIPLYRGADPPGASGRGAMPDGAPAGGAMVGPGAAHANSWRAQTQAARALVDASCEYEGRLVVLGLGALSAIAGAAEIDPAFYRRLAAIKVMGGYLGPLRFRREVHELTFSAAPEAARSVLRAPAPVTVMSAQLCLNARFGARELVLLNRGPGWLRRAVREWARTFGRVEGRTGFYLWDLLPAASVLEPDRFPRRLVRLASSVRDLETGALKIGELPDESGPDPAEPGIVDLPETVIRADRFVRECARQWKTGALRGA